MSIEIVKIYQTEIKELEYVQSNIKKIILFSELKY